MPPVDFENLTYFTPDGFSMWLKSNVYDTNMLYLYGILIYRNKMPACVTRYIAEYIKYDTDCEYNLSYDTSHCLKVGHFLEFHYKKFLNVKQIKDMSRKRKRKQKKLKYKLAELGIW